MDHVIFGLISQIDSVLVSLKVVVRFSKFLLLVNLSSTKTRNLAARFCNTQFVYESGKSERVLTVPRKEQIVIALCYTKSLIIDVSSFTASCVIFNYSTIIFIFEQIYLFPIIWFWVYELEEDAREISGV